MRFPFRSRWSCGCNSRRRASGTGAVFLRRLAPRKSFSEAKNQREGQGNRETAARFGSMRYNRRRLAPVGRIGETPLRRGLKTRRGFGHEAPQVRCAMQQESGRGKPDVRKGQEKTEAGRTPVALAAYRSGLYKQHNLRKSCPRLVSSSAARELHGVLPPGAAVRLSPAAFRLSGSPDVFAMVPRPVPAPALQSRSVSVRAQ